MNTQTTDQIQKEIVLKASRSRVWKAISDAKQFGEWFQVDMSGVTFRAGQPAIGKMTYPGFEGHKFEMLIDRVEPERLFSFKWHPYGIDPNYDYSTEPMTTCEFVLEDADGGTKLTITETGFDAVPLSRRTEAFRMNDMGWGMQIENIRKYVEGK